MLIMTKYFYFQGAGESVFDGKYSTLKKNELLWEKPEETDVVPLAAGTDKHSCAQKTGSASNSSSAGRILTKGFIKEIFTGVSGGAGAGASTRTMMAGLVTNAFLFSILNRNSNRLRYYSKRSCHFTENIRITKSRYLTGS